MRKNNRNNKKRSNNKERNGLRVEVYNNNVDVALKKFKKIVKNSNIMMELKEKQYYTKPSEKRREKINKIRSRIKYQNLKN